MTPENFTGQMTRLANIFHPGKFKDDGGEILAQEYWDAIGSKANDSDLAQAVEWLRDNYEGYFPQPAAVRRAVKDMAVRRIERERDRERMRQIEAPPADRAKVKKILDDYLKRSAEKAKIMEEEVQRCDECAIGEEVDRLTIRCKHSLSEGGTMLPSGGRECSEFESKDEAAGEYQDEVPF